MGDWIGVVCNVLCFMNHFVTAIFMHNGLDLWMLHVGRFALKFAHFGLI